MALNSALKAKAEQFDGLMSRRYELSERIAMELDRAYAKHGEEPWGRHEFYAILLEKVEELWDDIKADAPQAHVEAELVQVAAMCFRYFETGDRYLLKRAAVVSADAPSQDQPK